MHYECYEDSLKGVGLRCSTTKILKGTPIDWYWGDYVFKGFETPYTFFLDSTTFEAIVPSKILGVHFVNDFIGSNISNFNAAYFLGQCRFDNGVHKRPILVAIRDIEIGEPIETFYGSIYWKNRNEYSSEVIFKAQHIYDEFMQLYVKNVIDNFKMIRKYGQCVLGNPPRSLVFIQ